MLCSFLPLGPVTISDRGAGASSRGPSPDRGRDRSRFKLVVGLGGAGRRLGVLGRQDPCCGAVARVVARTGFLPTLRPRTPAPWSRPDVVVRVDRCSLSCSAGTVRHPPPPLGSAGRARGNGTEEIMYTTLPNVFSRVFSCARRLVTCHVLLFCREFGTRLCLLVPGEPLQRFCYRSTHVPKLTRVITLVE